MEDDYIHVDSNIIYTMENVPGPTEISLEYGEIVNDYNSQLTNTCDCNGLCEISTSCYCNSISGGYNYIVDSNMKLSEDKLKNNVIGPIMECNDLCSCSQNCGNRLVQKGPLKCLHVKSCLDGKGLGLFTTELISKHSFICEYAGEVITKAQAEKRHQLNILNGKMNYIFCLNEHTSGQILQTFVDPSEFGNIGRYANHSCDPNCVIIPVRVNTPIPKLALFSTRDILPHTEITFHYGSNNNSANLLTKNRNRIKCLCNTDKCTGLMPYEIY